MRVTLLLTLMGASLALAAPTPTTESDIPTQLQPRGPKHSVERRAAKRHLPGEPLPGEPIPAVEERSVEHTLSEPEHYEVLVA